MLPKGAAVSPLKQLSVGVSKGALDLLLDNGQGHFPILLDLLRLATRAPSDRPHAPLDAAQYSLQQALFKRLTTLARAADPATASRLSAAVSQILSADKQLLVVAKVALALNGGSKDVSRAAWEALQAYAALATAAPSTTDSARSPLAPVVEAFLTEHFRPNRGVYQILALLLPTFVTEDLAQWAPALPSTLLAGMGSADNISFRGALLGAVFVKMQADQAVSEQSWQWVHAAAGLARHLRECTSATRFNLIQFVVRPLAEAQPAALLQLVQSVEAGGDGEEEAWIALVSLGTSLSLCADIGASAPAASAAGKPLIPISSARLTTILSHPSPVVRLGVYRLVTDRSAIGAPVTEGEWSIARTFLDRSMNVGDSDARSNIIARTSHLLRRLKNSTYASHRQLQGLLARATDGRTEAESARIAELQAYLARSDAMLRWIFDRCFDSLIIGGSYPRTYVALRLLGLVIASSACADYPVFAADVQSLPGLKASTEAPSKGNGPAGDILWPARVELFAEDVAGRERVRKVVRCLKSTFTDIRVCALSILEQATVPLPGLGDAASIEALLQEALLYASNPRGSESTTGALVLRLIYTLKAKDAGQEQAGGQFVSDLLTQVADRLALSHEDVILAASTQPVHGLLSALQQILPLLPSADGNQHVFERALDVIVQAWESTRRILSSVDAGDQPAEDDVDHEEARAAKIVSASSETGGRRERELLLSWAWRTMREGSALLSIVAQRLLGSSSASLDTAQQIGGLFIAFLSEIRHPGAFLSIFPHYSEVLAAINSSSGLSDEIKALPATWLKVHLTTVSGFHKTSGRRSAGLPYAMLGVVLGQPKLAPDAFAALFGLADDGEEETTRIAAINTLKVLCNNSKMSHDLARTYERAVTVAMRSLSSPSWGVRNVGLQLMGALVKKGFSKNTASTNQDLLNVWFSQYPSLHSLFIASLDAISQEQLDDSPGAAFVILQFLRCLRASPSETELQDAFLPHIERFSRCKQIDIRLAAAAATPSVIPSTAVGSFIFMANLTAAPTSQNALHGKLSQILVLLEESVAGLTYTPGKGLVDYIRQAQDSMLARNPCGPTQALFVQVVQAVRAKTPDLPADVFATTDDFCRQRVQSTFDAAPAPGADAANLAAARYIIALHEPPSLLESPNPEVVEIALSEPTFTSASLEQRMAIAGIAVSAESNQRARLEALAWAHRYSQQDFTKVPPSRWDRILAEFEQSRNQPLRQALLAVLGKAIGQCASQDRVEALLAHLEASSEESQSVETRLSAMAALTGSAPTLSALAETSPAIRLRFHQLVGRLLLDDDAEARAEAGTLVGRTVGARPSGLAHEDAVRLWDEECLRACAELPKWRAALWSSLANGLSPVENAVNTADEPFVLFATEPENAFREAELDVRRTAALLLQSSSASAQPDELAAHRKELPTLAAGQATAEEDAQRHVLPDAADDARVLAALRLRALEATLAARPAA